jgi:hypothetical protein
MDHCKMMLQIDAPKNNQLYTAAAEYGLDVFSFELLLECESSQLNEKEKQKRYFCRIKFLGSICALDNCHGICGCSCDWAK